MVDGVSYRIWIEEVAIVYSFSGDNSTWLTYNQICRIQYFVPSFHTEVRPIEH